jgi:hypothetical protein
MMPEATFKNKRERENEDVGQDGVINNRRKAVKLNYKISEKPRGLGIVENDDLVAVINERNLLEKKRKWNRSDMHAVCNVIQGHVLYFAFCNPVRYSLLLRFHNRMYEEILKDEYFKLITE